jgi:hypothetical protein
MSKFQWYCPRGARRGLILAAGAAAIWFGWAFGYGQGTLAVPQDDTRGEVTVPADTSCCLKRLDT